MATESQWTIVGSNDLAGRLRAAATVIPARQPVTIVTEPTAERPDAIATGDAVLAPQGRTFVSHLFGLRVLEDVAENVRLGELGSIYGMYASIRVQEQDQSDLRGQLASCIGYVLAVFDRPVARVMAFQSSLVSENDAYFVVIRLDDSTIITLEAMYATQEEILLEVTGSERVLRAEPTRQAVRVEHSDGATSSLAWHEDEAERLLAFIASNPNAGVPGDTLQQIMSAIDGSIQAREAINL